MSFFDYQFAQIRNTMIIIHYWRECEEITASKQPTWYEWKLQCH